MYKKFAAKKSASAKLAFVVTDVYREQVRSQSKIGKRGYTIAKSALHPDDLAILYKELYLSPEVHGPVTGNPDDLAFPVYRENSNKIYLPRFYGLDRYGRPDVDENGARVESIDIPFLGPMRDYQDTVIATYLDHVNKVPSDQTSGGIIQLQCGAGKTVIALKILTMIGKKTLIVVHKEFLLNQWVDRIHEFLPSAKIGRIQGPLLDIHGKDIVIGMMQTLYDRDFPDGTFDSFGLTIVDEVHRIGSCQFSRTLLRVQTPYMLGVTATLERKDGLTKLIHYFMGPLAYHVPQKPGTDAVNVRGIHYVSRDPEFNETVLDFRGNPQFSTMISKLCAHGPRTQFIVQVIRDLLQEDPEAQILVLGHNRCLLVDLHKAIHHLGFATAGFYLGGMKHEDLEATKEQQILLASFAMASEGFDHKSLSKLIMVSPKVDIIQSVGRILRQKHDNPVIVDIIDSHDVFQRQWLKRRAYYKKCGYQIRSITSGEYKGMDLAWESDTTWKWVTKAPGSSEPKVEKGTCMIKLVE